MAKVDKKTKSNKKAAKSNSGKKGIFGPRFFLIFSILVAIVMLPSTVLLTVGMLPTLVVGFVIRERSRSRVITVGSLNLSGCSPFLMELWMRENSIEQALSILADPKSIIIMYSLAGLGYIVYWALTGIAASFLYQRGLLRQVAIEERMDSLIARWGKKVSGDVLLDEKGFEIDNKD